MSTCGTRLKKKKWERLQHVYITEEIKPLEKYNILICKDFLIVIFSSTDFI